MHIHLHRYVKFMIIVHVHVNPIQQTNKIKVFASVASDIYWVVMGKELVVHDLQCSETLRIISSISNNLNQIANRMNLFSTKTGDKENLYEIINMLYDLMTEEFQHLKTDKEK